MPAIRVQLHRELDDEDLMAISQKLNRSSLAPPGDKILAQLVLENTWRVDLIKKLEASWL